MQNNSEIKSIEFAELLGVHKSRISQLRKNGNLVLSADGKLIKVFESLEQIIKTCSIVKMAQRARHAKDRFDRGGSSQTTVEKAQEILEKNTELNKPPIKQKIQQIKEIQQNPEEIKQNSDEIQQIQQNDPDPPVPPQNPSDDYEYDKRAVTVDTALDEYNIARAKNEIRKGEQMEIEIAKSKQELVSRDAVLIAISSVAGNVKSSIERMPDRLGTLLADETDPHIIYQIIQDEVISILLSLQQGIESVTENL